MLKESDNQKNTKPSVDDDDTMVYRNDVLEEVAKVIEQFKIPSAAKKRNWLKLAPKIKRRGNAAEITEEYMLSGPNGWLSDVYGQAQLEGGSSE